jgi:hypothetical protein
MCADSGGDEPAAEGSDQRGAKHVHRAVERDAERMKGPVLVPCSLRRAVVATRPIEEHSHAAIGQPSHFRGTPVAMLLPVGHHDAELRGFVLDRMLSAVHRPAAEDGGSRHGVVGIERHTGRMSERGVAGNGIPLTGCD